MKNYSPYSQKELLQRIADGDKEAYRQFFDQHYSPLTFFAHSVIGNMTDAEDIVQETFLRLWTKRHTLQAQGHLRAFLYTMVKNACFDFLRRLETRTARQEEIQYLAEQDSHFLDSAVLQEELLQQLLEEIHALPEKYRTVITMVFLEGLTYHEISTNLNIPEATVRKQKERGLGLLNQAMLRRTDLPALIIAAQLIFLATFVTKQ